MIKFLKDILKKILKLFGYEIINYYPEIEQKSFDEIYKEIFRDRKIVIFDVGANQGQSIDRFDKLFKEKMIHSFEPISFEFEKIKKKFDKINYVKINNFALGDTIEKKDFFVNKYTGSSSFLKINENTKWAKLRSKQFNIEPKDFTKEKKNVQIDTIDNYSNTNKISTIDILKIDTQGYEEKVLLGALNLVKNKKIKIIEFEIIFSDIYNETLSIGKIENILGDNYRLFANDNKGNLYSNFIYQLNLIYIEKKFFSEIKNSS